MTTIAFGADHAGFPLKQHLVQRLAAAGYDIIDHGTDSTESVDYPAFCAAAARSVRDGDADFGIVIGGSGQGEQLAANKVRGCAPRCATASTPPAWHARTTTRTCCRSAVGSSARASPRRSSTCSSPPPSKAGATSAASTRSPSSKPRILNGALARCRSRPTPTRTPRSRRCWRSRSSARPPGSSSSPARTSPRPPSCAPPGGAHEQVRRGLPGQAYYGGNVYVDGIEGLAIDRVKALFGAEHANVQPHSGANANMCAYQALLGRATPCSA